MVFPVACDRPRALPVGTHGRRRPWARKSFTFRLAISTAPVVFVGLTLLASWHGNMSFSTWEAVESPVCDAAAIKFPDGERKWTQVATTALKEAEALMVEDTKVLDAECVLHKALKRLRDKRANAARLAAIQQVEQSAVYADVRAKAMLYDSVSGVLAPENFSLCWEGDNAKMYINSPSGASWFEYRLVAHIDAPLPYCIAPQHERDLIQEYQPVFIEPHMPYGPQGRHYSVVRTLSKIMAFYVEAVFENLRVSNFQYGFLIERVRSDFPSDGLALPEKNWWSHRVHLDTKNLWIPVGSTADDGTVLISVSRVNVGAPIPENVISFFFHRFAGGILDNVRRGAALSMEQGSRWNTRVKEDKDGFYAELAKVQKAATKRRAVSVQDLPGPEIFDRPWRLEASDSIDA